MGHPQNKHQRSCWCKWGWQFPCKTRVGSHDFPRSDKTDSRASHSNSACKYCKRLMFMPSTFLVEQSQFSVCMASLCKTDAQSLCQGKICADPAHQSLSVRGGKGLKRTNLQNAHIDSNFETAQKTCFRGRSLGCHSHSWRCREGGKALPLLPCTTFTR